MNHFSSVCMRKGTKSYNKAVDETTYGTTEEEEIADSVIDAVDSVACKSVWFVDIFVHDQKLVAKVDTGAQVNILNRFSWANSFMTKLNTRSMLFAKIFIY